MVLLKSKSRQKKNAIHDFFSARRSTNVELKSAHFEYVNQWVLRFIWINCEIFQNIQNQNGCYIPENNKTKQCRKTKASKKNYYYYQQIRKVYSFHSSFERRQKRSIFVHEACVHILVFTNYYTVSTIRVGASARACVCALKTKNIQNLERKLILVI